MTDAAGRSHSFGDGSGEPVKVRMLDRRAEMLLALDPALKLGELFADGRFVVEEGTIYDFLDLVTSNLQGRPMPWWATAMAVPRYLMRRFAQYNPVGRAQRNVAHHYDLDRRLYELFLDSDRQYSCGYFERADASLEEAQLAKKRHLAAKLDLHDGQSVLDIGSGWGGLGLYLAKAAHVAVTGVTLSKEQHEISRVRAEREGLGQSVEFLLKDYRLLEGPFDRIVSVGMFEHVGVGHYREFFEKAHDLLDEQGVMVLHSIGRADGPSMTNPWIAKYIFPGGYIPALSEVLPAIENARLYVTDIEILRLHYAETLRAWRERFVKNWEAAAKLYDERFCRMWEFYLASSESAFRHQDMMVFQIQLVKDQNALPLTRDYIGSTEEILRHNDRRRPGDSHRMAGE
jgi:cyclopropane-fatty-acyl-phospholipid synthase